MKYVFPRQFRLHNVFTCKIDHRETGQPFKDYTIREAEIQSTQPANVGLATSKETLGLRLPKRLRGGPWQLVSAIRKRHQRCSYVELLRYYCPAPVSLPESKRYND